MNVAYTAYTKCILPNKTTQSLGPVRGEIAEEFNLPIDCIVSPGGGDNMMSALGMLWLMTSTVLS